MMSYTKAIQQVFSALWKHHQPLLRRTLATFWTASTSVWDHLAKEKPEDDEPSPTPLSWFLTDPSCSSLHTDRPVWFSLLARWWFRTNYLSNRIRSEQSDKRKQKYLPPFCVLWNSPCECWTELTAKLKNSVFNRSLWQ